MLGRSTITRSWPLVAFGCPGPDAGMEFGRQAPRRSVVFKEPGYISALFYTSAVLETRLYFCLQATAYTYREQKQPWAQVTTTLG